jgi:hypothetical protein
MQKTHELLCQLPAQTASERIEDLLSRERVKYRAADLFVTSTSTPIAALGIQSKLYSRSNWVGINPFAFVSSVDVRCERSENGFTRVTVHVNRRRAFLWVGFWVACSFLAALGVPEPGGVIMVIAVTCAAWLSIVSFFGGYLVKREIGDCLKTGLTLSAD